jgi:excisionase family DNA binding protein
MTREKALLGHRSAISGQTHQAAMVQQENRPGNLESLLTIDTLMSLLGVSRPTVYTLMEQESLPYIKMGRSLRFRPSAIHTWLLEHEQMR